MTNFFKYMSRLLNRFELADEIRNIIIESKKYLTLISPYFKLNDGLLGALLTHIESKDFKLIIVYGKNEDEKYRSLSDDDLNFFKQFPNVEIRYHKRLHAKIYLNEDKCLLTSMNLHDFSMKENIEFGILTKARIINVIPSSLDQQAVNFAYYIVDKSNLEFKSGLKKTKSFFGLITTKKETIVEVDNPRYGYCIRTGVQIPFFPSHPFCAEAYQSWSKYRNFDYKENYCHKTGKPSYGKTSMRNPIL